MDRRLRATARDTGERLHRFLRPGALARLRDSKIIARSLRSAAVPATRLLPPSSPPPPTPPPPSLDHGAVPHFLGATRGAGGVPRYPLRKKLAAARCVVFLPPPSPEAFFDAFAPSPDLVAVN